MQSCKPKKGKYISYFSENAWEESRLRHGVMFYKNS